MIKKKPFYRESFASNGDVNIIPGSIRINTGVSPGNMDNHKAEHETMDNPKIRLTWINTCWKIIIDVGLVSCFACSFDIYLWVKLIWNK